MIEKRDLFWLAKIAEVVSAAESEGIAAFHGDMESGKPAVHCTLDTFRRLCADEDVEFTFFNEERIKLCFEHDGVIFFALMPRREFANEQA